MERHSGRDWTDVSSTLAAARWFGQSGAVNSSGDPRRVVEQAWAAVQAHDWERMSGFFAPGYVRHTDTGRLSFDLFQRLLQEEHTAFPDTRFALSDFIVGVDRVAFRWASRATHRGPYLDVPPTGREVTASGITMSRVEGGKIVEDWTSWNKHELLATLGIIPIETSPPGFAVDGAAAETLRAVHRKFPTGVTIVTTLEGSAPTGLAVNAFSSVSLDPPLVLFCVGRSALTYPRLFAGDAVCVNILARQQRRVAERFAVSGGDKFERVEWSIGRNGAPLLDGCAAQLEGVIEARIAAPTHTIFITRVTAARAFEREPLVYLDGAYFDSKQLEPAP
jgi:flavin reductase (DIM6/NTAB) family NADH-FMN oxidoreductase RutF/predicted ester cyclase